MAVNYKAECADWEGPVCLIGHAACGRLEIEVLEDGDATMVTLSEYDARRLLAELVQHYNERDLNNE